MKLELIIMKLELIIIIIIIIISYYNYNYCKRENERERKRETWTEESYALNNAHQAKLQACLPSHQYKKKVVSNEVYILKLHRSSCLR